jgi:hypothetical protein
VNDTLEKNASNQSGGTIDKNASNQSGGSFSSEGLVAGSTVDGTLLGCGTNGLYPYPTTTSSSKKTIRTTTTVREYNDEGKIVKETETVVEEETNPVYTTPYSPYTVTF